MNIRCRSYKVAEVARAVSEGRLTALAVVIQVGAVLVRVVDHHRDRVTEALIIILMLMIVKLLLVVIGRGYTLVAALEVVLECARALVAERQVEDMDHIY